MKRTFPLIMPTREELHRRALLHEQAAKLLREDAGRHETEARRLREEATYMEDPGEFQSRKMGDVAFVTEGST